MTNSDNQWTHWWWLIVIFKGESRSNNWIHEAGQEFRRPCVDSLQNNDIVADYL